MRVTRPMLEAAIRAEHDYLRRVGGVGQVYVPNEERLRAIVQGVLDHLNPPAPPADAQPTGRRSVVTAKKPRRRV